MAGKYEQLCSRLDRGTNIRRQSRVARRSILLLGLALACASACGCVTLSSLWPCEKPPIGMPCQVATRWDNGIRQTCDPLNGGAPLRALSGRMYLLDPQAKTWVSADGTVVVDLFDDRPLSMGSAPIHLEEWRFPNEVLQRLVSKDGFGWGYTLPLPWVNSYRPDITQVHLRVCFVRKDGTPLYAESTSLNLGLADAVLPPGAVQTRAGKVSMPSNTPAAISAQMAAASQQKRITPPEVLRLGGPTQTQPVVPTAAYAPAAMQKQPVAKQSAAAPDPDQPKPIAIPVHGKPRPLPVQTQPITQASAQMPVQPAPQASWIGQAK